MSPDTEQAIRMLDFLGARYFELTVNDLKGEKMATATTPHRTRPSRQHCRYPHRGV